MPTLTTQDQRGMQTDQSAPQATSTGGSESILVWEGREIFVDKRMVGGWNDIVHKYFKRRVEQRKGSAGPRRNAWLRALGALAGD